MKIVVRSWLRSPIAAAIRGARGLTHRAVDQLGRPARRLIVLLPHPLRPGVRGAPRRPGRSASWGTGAEEQPSSPSRNRCARRSAVCAWTAEGGLLVLARHELLLESARQPEIHQTLIAASGDRSAEDRIANSKPTGESWWRAELHRLPDGIALAAAVAGNQTGRGRSVTGG